MKPTQNTIIRVLPAVAFLTVIALRYLRLPPHGPPDLLSSEWAVFGAALAFVLVAVGRRLLRRWRRLPSPQPLSRNEIGFCVIVTLVGCMISSVGVSLGTPWLTGLGGMFVVVSIALRAYPRQPDAPIVPTQAMVLRLVVLVPLSVCLMLFCVFPAAHALAGKMTPVQPQMPAHPAAQKEAAPLPEPMRTERGK